MVLLVDKSREEFISIMNNWVSTLHKKESQIIVHATLSSWNCRNCGGPNLNQPKCAYCGAIKE